jgi:putative ABC transport system substrate-binding protein
MTRDLLAAVRTSGASARAVPVDSMKAVEREFRNMHARGERLVIAYPIYFDDEKTLEAIAQMALRNRIALVSYWTEWVRVGALLAYSPNHRNEPRRLASQIALILRGASPATIPFELPEVTELVVNRASAGKLGIRIPPEVLIAATAIIG